MANPREAERIWRRIHRAADSKRGDFVRLILRAFARGQKAVSLDELADAVERNDQRDAERLLNIAVYEIQKALSLELPTLLYDTLVAGAQAGVDKNGLVVAAARQPKSMVEVIMSFDKTNPEALNWAKTHSAELVKEITDTTKQALKGIVGTAFEQHRAPRPTAKAIRDQIGLTAKQSQAVTNRRLRLIKGGMSEAKATATANKFAELQRKRRALVIARTETIAASNEGQRQLWLQAVQRGYLSPGALRKWIVTPDDRLCKTCKPLNGKLAGLNEKFQAKGAKATIAVMGPPLHPQCRCAVILAKETKPVVQPPAPTSVPSVKVPSPDIELRKAVDAEWAEIEGVTGKQEELAKLGREREELHRQVLQDVGRLPFNDPVIQKNRKKLQDLRQKIDELRQSYVSPADGLKAKIMKDSGVRVRVLMPKDATGLLETRIKDGVDAFQKMLPANSPLNKKTIAFRVIPSGEEQRAYYQGLTVYLPKNASRETIVHELGHWFEDTTKGALDRSLKFLERRTKGEELKKLNEIKKTAGAYRPHEVAREDKFLNAYMGKDYGGKYTEIVSMGMQLFFENPLTLLTKDPDYFKFIYYTLRGLLA